MLIALIVLSSLATLGTLTTMSVQASLKASTNDRSQTVALYAAESGGAMAIEFLRKNFDRDFGWGAFVAPLSAPRAIPAADFPPNGALPSDPNNPFSADQHAWFFVEVLNNHDDSWKGPAFPNVDSDGRVVVRSTGHGPQGSLAIIEWEIERVSAAPNFPAPPFQPTPVPVKPPGYTWDFSGSLAPDKPVIILSWRTVL